MTKNLIACLGAPGLYYSPDYDEDDIDGDEFDDDDEEFVVPKAPVINKTSSTTASIKRPNY